MHDPHGHVAERRLGLEGLQRASQEGPLPLFRVTLGTLGRSQACALSLRVWGDSTITDEVLESWLDRLITRNGWLTLGRKKPWPHESFFAVSGYFFYFGHYYAAASIPLLPEKDRAFYQDHIAALILELQEADGSWFDYPLYDYHKGYGTGFALLTLAKCKKGK